MKSRAPLTLKPDTVSGPAALPLRFRVRQALYSSPDKLNAFDPSRHDLDETPAQLFEFTVCSDWLILARIALSIAPLSIQPLSTARTTPAQFFVGSKSNPQ